MWPNQRSTTNLILPAASFQATSSFTGAYFEVRQYSSVLSQSTPAKALSLSKTPQTEWDL